MFLLLQKTVKKIGKRLPAVWLKLFFETVKRKEEKKKCIESNPPRVPYIGVDSARIYTFLLTKMVTSDLPFVLWVKVKKKRRGKCVESKACNYIYRENSVRIYTSQKQLFQENV